MSVPLRFVIWIPVAILLFGAFPPISAGDRPLEGRVVDREGRGIPDATIFLTGLVIPSRGACGVEPQHRLFETPRRDPTTLRSAADGTFEILLPGGRYQVAASKVGYDISLSEINTLSLSPLRLSLLPEETIRLGDLPVGPPGQELGMRWILRRQAGDVLRDEAPLLTPGGAGEGERRAAWPVEGPSVDGRAGRAELSQLLAPLSGQVGQAYSGASLTGGEATGPGDSAGRTTAVLVGGDLDHGRWMFDGWSGRSSSRLGADQDLLVGHRADRVLVGLEHSFGTGDRLSGDLEYSGRHYSIEPRGGTAGAADQDQRTVALRSRWERRLGDRASLYVAGSYFETGVRAAGSDPFAPDGSSEPDGLPRRAVDRSLLAVTGVTFENGAHRFELGLRTRRYLYELRDQGILLYNPGDSWSVAETGTTGQSMSLQGGDSWRFAPRYALSYGLGFHTGPGAPAGCLVPRMGLTREPSRPGGIRLSSDLLWSIDDPGGSGSPAGEPPGYGLAAGAGRLGYLVGIERHPEQGLQLAASLSYRPFAQGFDTDGTRMRPGTGVWGEAPLFLGDGRIGRREIDLQLARRFGPVSGSLVGRVGQARGQLAPALLQAPIQVTAPGELRYILTSLRALYMPTDTEVQVGYRRVSSDTPAGLADAGAALEYSRLDLVVYQDVPWLQSLVNARWQLLMAYQGLDYGARQRGAAGAVLPSGNASRLSGGVNISF